MFVQVIKGRTSDPEGLRRQGERSESEVRPGAIGLLGATSGVADDGTFLTIARFTDEASARKNADRPEQSAWWNEMAKYLDGEPTFRESSDVQTLFDGGSDNAGFVQIMEMKVTDRAKAEAMESPEALEQLRSARPDVIGGLRIWFSDQDSMQVIYFTSEEQARKAESSAEFEDQQNEFNSVFTDISFTDLRDPILIS